MTPSNLSNPLADINDARATIAGLRAALIGTPDSAPRPERILACVPALSDAAGRLNTIENELRRADRNSVSRELTQALKGLKSDLQGVAKLIEYGATFYLGWARLLGAAAAGYTPSGEAASLTARGSVALKG